MNRCPETARGSQRLPRNGSPGQGEGLGLESLEALDQPGRVVVAQQDHGEQGFDHMRTSCPRGSADVAHFYREQVQSHGEDGLSPVRSELVSRCTARAYLLLLGASPVAPPPGQWYEMDTPSHLGDSENHIRAGNIEQTFSPTFFWR